MTTTPKNDHLLLGVAINLVGTLLGLLVIYFLMDYVRATPFDAFLNNMTQPSEFSAKLLALSQLINIPSFYFLMRKRMTRTFRGMMVMFFVYIVYTIIVKFAL